MEWLFFATKESQISSLTLIRSITVLMVTACTVTVILLAVLLVLSLPSILLNNQKLTWLTSLPTAVMLTVTALILFDNFTYSIFKFGIGTSSGIIRAVYGLGFIATFYYYLRFVQKKSHTKNKYTSYLAIGLLTISFAFTLPVVVGSLNARSKIKAEAISNTGKLPNIIILGSDGLSARYLSAYGANEQTTPFLNELVKTSLVADNAFPNATSTTASTTSMLTGKEAVKVRVYRYPDILNGEDSYQHLPGILKQYGYHTFEIGTTHYVDAHLLNLLNGFDVVNDQTSEMPALTPIRAVLGNSSAMFFIQTILDRASERIMHIFYIQKMKNPIVEVDDPESRTSDSDRVQTIIDLIDSSDDQPFFAFVHLMDTHGPYFSFKEQVYSLGETQDKWNINAYRDSLRNYDGHVKTIYDHLVETGQLDNTILVLYTDHGFIYKINERIPIIIRFPQGQYEGHLQSNVQVIDIAPTMLDYLGIPVPEWMNGISLLKGEPSPTRMIFSTAASSPPKLNPPFRSLRLVQVIVCQNWYTLSLRDDIFENGSIYQHISNCDQSSLPTNSEVRTRILEYLLENGYEIGSLK